jgi:predicted NBD/HSP70 family sugar kinase
VKNSEVLSATVGVRRIFRGGRKAFANARSKDDQALHEWRKQARYLLNQLDILTAVFNVDLRNTGGARKNWPRFWATITISLCLSRSCVASRMMNRQIQNA